MRLRKVEGSSARTTKRAGTNQTKSAITCRSKNASCSCPRRWSRADRSLTEDSKLELACWRRSVWRVWVLPRVEVYHGSLQRLLAERLSHHRGCELTAAGSEASRLHTWPGRVPRSVRAARRSRDQSRDTRARSASGFATPRAT